MKNIKELIEINKKMLDIDKKLISCEEATKVCAIIDLQGYSIGNKFYPKEIGLYNDKDKLSFEIECNFTKEFIKQNKKTLYYQFKHIHGIPFRNVLSKKNVHVWKSEDLDYLLKTLYFRHKTNDKFLFGIKNSQLSKILNKLEIPYLDLNITKIKGEKCPSVKTFFQQKKLNNFCVLHNYLNKNLINRCALQKSLYIWEWLINESCSKILYQELQELRKKQFNIERYFLDSAC